MTRYPQTMLGCPSAVDCSRQDEPRDDSHDADDDSWVKDIPRDAIVDGFSTGDDKNGHTIPDKYFHKPSAIL